MIWLIGSNGQLGCEVAKILDQKKINWIGTNSEVDISDWDSICSFERKNETESYYHSKMEHYEKQIKWIINCSGYTNVEAAEIDKEKADLVNNIGPTNLARLCRKIGAKLIHISTDYVFDGVTNHPYTEKNIKNPLNIYGITKANGETSIEKEMVQYYIIRTSWLYGNNENNFVSKMIKKFNENDSVKVINDQIGCPTYTGDLADIIIKMMEKAENATEIVGPKSAPAFGIYNFSNSGEITWYDFATEILKYGKKFGLITNDSKLESCSSSEYDTKVIRPKYSVLDNTKISKELKIKPIKWKSSLEKYLKSIRK